MFKLIKMLYSRIHKKEIVRTPAIDKQPANPRGCLDSDYPISTENRGSTNRPVGNKVATCDASQEFEQSDLVPDDSQDLNYALELADGKIEQNHAGAVSASEITVMPDESSRKGNSLATEISSVKIDDEETELDIPCSVAAKEHSSTLLRRYKERNSLSVKEIIGSKENLTDKIGMLYDAALADNTEFSDLEAGIAMLEKLTDAVPFKYEKTRKDLITLESVLRAKKAYQNGQKYDALGKAMGELDYSKYTDFRAFLMKDIFRNASRIDKKDTFSPVVSEEGTFHMNSIYQYCLKGK